MAINNRLLSNRIVDGLGDFTRINFTRVSATSMKLPGDWRFTIRPGSMIKLNDGGTTKYGYTIAQTYSSGNDETTLTLTTLNDNLRTVTSLSGNPTEVYIGNSNVMSDHPMWIQVNNPTLSGSGGSSPTINTIDFNRFKIVGFRVFYRLRMRMNYGSAANSYIRISYPVAPDQASDVQTIAGGFRGGTGANESTNVGDDGNTSFFRVYRYNGANMPTSTTFWLIGEINYFYNLAN